ncbi:MAG: LacI family DNA-binding transcriptional regulator [Gammaproteobacteria bacterium]|nr:LacI family DNA-binding transcriptional regulator [Gammaproteobacteria bacterium]MDH3372945.1 LacI family DNA-binding transcriptional regulator [Gammaproteobacteria bacterium]MDH3410193.1 LacI family DNA-binding transcriptional regulator [Gammaproteobacteria bacterium]MDH3554199.1 LacI family DNA-binding transcriptional regulator [Gammaproteobacteria bacterium]
MATIYEVSKLAGVSLATVSRVINDSGRVSPKTRDKVLSAMRELDYRPNTIAQSLASNRSNCVGILVSEVYGPFFGGMLSGIEAELRSAGKLAMFATGHSNEAQELEAIKFLLDRNCDALILHVEALSDEYLLEQKDGAMPFVVMNRAVSGLEDNCISLNNEQGGFLATNMLLEMSHRDIAYISGPLTWGDAIARLAGHKRALREHGRQFDDRLMVEGDYHEISGSNGMTQLLQQGLPFTAVVCANDEMAAGAMDMIRARGMSMPDDMSIVGFDNSPFSRYLYPKLSTVNFPIEDMGRMAAHWVLQNVYNVNGVEIKHVFDPKLVERASARPYSK